MSALTQVVVAGGAFQPVEVYNDGHAFVSTIKFYDDLAGSSWTGTDWTTETLTGHFWHVNKAQPSNPTQSDITVTAVAADEISISGANSLLLNSEYRHEYEIRGDSFGQILYGTIVNTKRDTPAHLPGYRAVDLRPPRGQVWVDADDPNGWVFEVHVHDDEAKTIPTDLTVERPPSTGPGHGYLYRVAYRFEGDDEVRFGAVDTSNAAGGVLGCSFTDLNLAVAPRNLPGALRVYSYERATAGNLYATLEVYVELEVVFTGLGD